MTMTKMRKKKIDKRGRLRREDENEWIGESMTKEKNQKKNMIMKKNSKTKIMAKKISNYILKNYPNNKKLKMTKIMTNLKKEELNNKDLDWRREKSYKAVLEENKK